MKVKERETAQDVGDGLGQSTAADATADPGSEVTLTVAVAIPKVPGVTGKLQSTATSGLKNAGYHVKTTRRSTTSVRNWEVMVQYPGGGTLRKSGSTVTLVVADVRCLGRICKLYGWTQSFPTGAPPLRRPNSSARGASSNK